MKIKVGVMCGERLYRLSSWKTYPLFWRSRFGFGIGPILFWDGS
jgi:hypothetical protein